MLISVIVPVYKVEKYLAKCMESVINQTYTDLEIILVDDGSPDGCPAICDGYAKKDVRIKVIHQKNGGLALARNAGLNAASGDLIAFVDSDDWCEPGMLSTLYEAYAKTKSPIVLCGAFIDWENGWRTQIRNFAAEDVTLSQEQALRLFFGEQLTAWACNKLYEKRLWRDFRFSAGQIFEDIPVFRNQLTCIDRLSIVAKPLYHYIQRGQSLSTSWNARSYAAYLHELDCNIEFSRARSGIYDDIIQPTALSVYFSILKEVMSSKNAELQDRVPFLLERIRVRKNLISKIKRITASDKILLFLISRGLSPAVCFAFMRPMQRAYHKLRAFSL